MFRPGDEVFEMVGGVGGLQGTLAEFISADANLLALKPKSLTVLQSAAVPLVTITAETEQERLSERAQQDRDIVYFLQQPETHAFSLYHDYTDTRVGVNGYANVVRTGSVASHPSAYVLDTGEQLKAEEMSGAEVMASKINTGEKVEEKDRVVVIPFAAVQAGQTLRLRIAETYTAPVSQLPDGRIRLDYWDDRPEAVDVLLRRSGARGRSEIVGGR